MEIEDKIIGLIDIITESNGFVFMKDTGYFLSMEDKSYRCEAVRKMFEGLRRENQNEVLRFLLDTLQRQNEVIVSK